MPCEYGHPNCAEWPATKAEVEACELLQRAYKEKEAEEQAAAREQVLRESGHLCSATTRQGHMCKNPAADSGAEEPLCKVHSKESGSDEEPHPGRPAIRREAQAKAIRALRDLGVMHLVGNWWRPDGRTYVGISKADAKAILNREMDKVHCENDEEWDPDADDERWLASALRAAEVRSAPIELQLQASRDPLALFDIDTCERVEGVPWQDAIVRWDEDDRSVKVDPLDRTLWSQKTAITYEWGDGQPRPTPLLDQTLVDWGLAEMADYVLAQIGWTLLEAWKDHGVVVLKGNGGSGKSTLVNLVTELAGGPPVRAESRLDKLGGRFGMGVVEAARLLTLSEMGERMRAKETRDGLEELKKLSGGDLVSIERKGRDEYTGRPSITTWISTNHEPSFATSANNISSWRRRQRLIPMNEDLEARGLKPDESLATRIAKAEGRSIAIKAVHAYRQWRADEKPIPIAVQCQIDQVLLAGVSPLDRWLHEHCRFDQSMNWRTHADRIIESARKWGVPDDIPDRTIKLKVTLAGAIREGPRSPWYQAIEVDTPADEAEPTMRLVDAPPSGEINPPIIDGVEAY
ncbi:DUF5906 domain-containing protein [Candidatus Poriferisocius sp.]|uniref:DUF5906 domain-containing protein n=1 Tax=Candidatus Poriferisocius sp. TaxID=3101276 RepID=UPI003B01CF5C